MSKLQGEVLTLPKMSGFASTPESLSGNVGAKTVNIGEDGATFIPSVSADGIVSWTNDKELPNPEPVNIKGVKGDKGERGERGLQGIQGIKGDKGETGATGAKGDPGEQGVRGEKGEKGDPGTNGKDGKDGANGQPGKDGSPGKDGADGYTPQKGTDYFTEADKAEMVSSVIAALPVYDGEVVSL
jgi:hypothetical protein